MKYFKSICLLMAMSLVIPALCSCGDDDEDSPHGENSPLYINGINLEGMWAFGEDADDFNDIEFLYKFTKDKKCVFYESDGYPLVNGIMQCALSNFHEYGVASWSVSGNTLRVSYYGDYEKYTIIKVISPDEAKVKFEDDEGVDYGYVRRVKGFKK